MRRLALNDEILLKIEKPARYIGNEINAVQKDKSKVQVRFCMCFPDVYEIGMSHLGIQILYDMFNQWEDVWCERVYSPWLDLDQIMRERQIPLFALESQDPVKDFDFLGITLQYEMCYTNILQILDLSRIPLKASHRTEEDPIVIGGGPCAYNPEPLADFFDLFYLGEGETSYEQLIMLYKKNKEQGKGRQEFLQKAAEVPGIYVPSLYTVTYHSDGTIASMEPNDSHAPARVQKQLVKDVTDTYYPRKPVVPFIKVTQDRVVLEVQRGCIRGCRFCQAGMLYRPTRERDLEMLKSCAKEMLKNTGHEEISLSSLSTSDYSRLGELVTFLIENFEGKGVNISLPSLRIDAFSLDVMGKVQDIRKSSLTFAPEAGSQRLRDVINKGLTEEVILEGAGQAFEGGWTKVKLYFMLGLPTETEEDQKGIAWLAEKIAKRYYEIPKDQRNGKCQITVSTSFFIPKPFTPFQWAPMCTKEEFLARAHVVNEEMKSQLNRKSLRYNWHEADVSVLEGAFARGDRRMAKVLQKAYEKGCLFDSWTECFRGERWEEAFCETGIDLAFYTTRERKADEIFPWDFIDIGVTKEFLYKEWERAQTEAMTANCRQQCQGCGAGRYKSGVCREKAETSALQKESIKQSALPKLEKQKEEPHEVRKIRVKFRKNGEMKFIGHLDLMRYFQKAIRRANINVRYSEGFSPHMIMSFAAPLGVGLTSDGEYLDIEIEGACSSASAVQALNRVMAEGMEIISFRRIPEGKASNAMSLVAAADYEVRFRKGYEHKEGWEERLDAFFAQKAIPVVKKTKKSEREIDIRPLIYQAERRKDTIFLRLSAGSADNLKPELVMEAFAAYEGISLSESDLLIHRLEIYGIVQTEGESRFIALEDLGKDIVM